MIANGAFGIAHSIVWSIGVPMLQLISHRLRTSTPLGIEYIQIDQQLVV